MENKRIIILGPVTTKNYFGGVANFDEELNEAFLRAGYESIVVTIQKDLINQKKGHVKQCSSFFTVYKFIRDYSPRIVIASLQYGAFFYILPKNIKKIYVLHGFFDRAYYSYLKSLLASLFQKLVILKTDRVVANSYFTQMINNDFFKIKADSVIQQATRQTDVSA